MKGQLIRCVAVLGSICLVVAALLAVVNHITAPIIEEAALEAQQAALRAVLPNASDFESVTLTDEVPDTVKEIYRDTAGTGYALIVHGSGHGGLSAPIVLAVGIDSEGKITRISVTEKSGESPGYVDKATASDYLAGYEGADSLLEGITTVSGATETSTGILNAVKDAFTAFAAVAEFEETPAQKIARLVYAVLDGMSEEIGYVSVPLPSGAGSVKSILRAKNASGYAVVLGDGAESIIVGLDSYLRVTRAIALDESALTPSAEQLSAILSMLESDYSAWLAQNQAGLAQLTDGTLSRLDVSDDTPAYLIDAYSITGDAEAAYGLIVRDGGILYAVTVKASGEVIALAALSPIGSSTEGFGLADEILELF